MEVGDVFVYGLDQWLGRCCIMVTAVVVDGIWKRRKRIRDVMRER